MSPKLIKRTKDAIAAGHVVQAARLMNLQEDLSPYAPEELHKLHDKFPLRFLNIGGGDKFLYPLWGNLGSGLID